MNVYQTSNRKAIEKRIESQGGRPTPDQVQLALGKDNVRKRFIVALLADIKSGAPIISPFLAAHIYAMPKSNTSLISNTSLATQRVNLLRFPHLSTRVTFLSLL